MIPLLKSSLERKNFTVPSNKYILSDFSVVQLIVYRAEFEAYEKIGGNGTAKVIFDEVVALERIDDKDIYQYEKENEK